MEKSSVAAPILSVKTAYSGVQSISSIIESPSPPSSSPQRGSRALSMRQHRYGNGDTSRHSRRSGDPEPFRCAKAVIATEIPPVILTAVRIQSPFDAPRRLCQRRHLPSFSPRWESRALSMRQDGYANEDTSRHSHRSGDPEPFRCANTAMPTKTPPVILTAVGI